MKKNYNQPIVESTQLMPASIVLAGSPGALQNSGNGTDDLGIPSEDPIIGG